VSHKTLPRHPVFEKDFGDGGEHIEPLQQTGSSMAEIEKRDRRKLAPTRFRALKIRSSLNA
jgi:hypothetical protein